MPDAGTKPELINAAIFVVEIDGIMQSGLIKEVSGLGNESDVIEHIQVGPKGSRVIIKTAGNFKAGEVTIKRALPQGDHSWYTWRQSVIDKGEAAARKHGVISGYDALGKMTFQWEFERGWPSKWKVSDLSAGSTENIVEEITVVHEGLVQKV
jgi:phage tail-like protein